MNELSHLLEVILHQTPGGQSWRAKPQSTRAQSTFISYTQMWKYNNWSLNRKRHFQQLTMATSQIWCTETKSRLIFQTTLRFNLSLQKRSCMSNCISLLKHTDHTWTGVLITSNGTSLQNLFSSSSIGSFAAQVQQDQMVVRAAYRWKDSVITNHFSTKPYLSQLWQILCLGVKI